MDFEKGIREVVGDVLTEEEIQGLFVAAYSDLEVAVGEALADGLSDAQLAEFESIIDAGDEEGATQWLEQERPDYKQVVNEEFEALLERLKEGLNDGGAEVAGA